MLKTILGAAAAIAAAGGLAHAAVIDFVAEAAGNERGVANGTTISFDGLDITFTAANGFAYFDDLSGGKPAGLGVCARLLDGPGSSCAVSADDNIRAGQGVSLALGQTSDLFNFSFNDRFHNSLNGNDTNTLLISVNNGAFEQYTFAMAVGLLLSGVDVISFMFDDAATGLQFYVAGFEASAVPLPGAAPLMLAGLAAAGFFARRRKAA